MRRRITVYPSLFIVCLFLQSACGTASQRQGPLERAKTILRQGMTDLDPAIRLRTIQIARRQDAAFLMPEMMQRLADPDPAVRSWAAVAMIQQPHGAKVFDDQLHSDSAKARAIVVGELGRLAEAGAYSTLLRYVTDTHVSVRQAAARSLAACKHPSAGAALRGLYADKDRSVRYAAIRGLSRIAVATDLSFFLTAGVDSYLGNRLAAIEALAQIGGSKAIQVLLAFAQGDAYFEALRAGVALAKHHRVQPGLNAIAKSLRDRRLEVRLAALSAAAGISDPVVPKLVEPALRDPSPRLRLSAARYLLRQHASHGAARKVILASVTAFCGSKTEDLALCHDAAAQAASWGDRKSTQVLFTAARKAKTPATRRGAIALALPLRGGNKLAVELMSDADPRIRLVAAAWILKTAR